MKPPILPGPGSRHFPRGFWPCFAFFIIAFFIFISIFYVQAKVESKISDFLELGAKHGLEFGGVEIHHFPPALSLATIAAPVGGKKLEIANLTIEPALFPPSLTLRCQMMGGILEARGWPDSVFNPAIDQVGFELKNISLEKMMALLPEQKFFSVNKGLLQASGKFLPHWRGQGLNPAKWGGNARLELQNGEIEQNFPLCKQNVFNNVNGEARAELNGTKLAINQLILHSGDVSFKLDGILSPWNRPLNANLNFNAELEIPPSLLEENLVPPAAMVKIGKSGLVKAHIGGVLKKPMLKLEN